MVRAIGPEFGLTDEVGRALTPLARRVLKGAKNAHRRARSIHLSGERLQAAHQAQVMDQNRLDAMKKLEELKKSAITRQEATESAADEAADGVRQ